MKKNNKKGFTLAELLIVVAIIAVLVAISIPIFTSQLEKARDATDQANIRSAYSEVVVQVLDGTISLGASGTSKEVTLKGEGTNDTWDNLGDGETFSIGGNTDKQVVAAKANFTKVTFSFDKDGQLTGCVLT